MPARRLLSARASIALLLGLSAGLGIGQTARAAVDGEAWEAVRIGVLPLRSYVRGPDDLFEERPHVRRLREVAGAWERRLEEALATLDLVEVVPGTTAAQAIGRSRTHRETLAVARERMSLGIERYRRLDLDASLDDLGRASSLFQQSFSDLSEPREMADVALYQGLAHSERGEANLAHIAFRRMWLLDPSRQIEPGYYPAATERALAGALVDLAALPDTGLARWPVERLAELARRAKVDAWLLALIEGSAEAPALRVAIFEARTGTLTMSERLLLHSGIPASTSAGAPVMTPESRGPASPDARGDDERVSALLDRALSAWHACTLTAVRRSLGRRATPKRFTLDLGYQHAMILQHDGTRDIFHAPGVQVGIGWAPAPSVELRLLLGQHTSIPDDNRDLLDPFSWGRVGLAAGLTGGSPYVRAFARVGVDASLTLADIAMSTDVDCKHFGPEHERCGRLVQTPAPELLLGFSVAAGARWSVTRLWFVYTSAEVTTWIAPTSLVGSLNFPLTVGAGVGTRF